MGNYISCRKCDFKYISFIFGCLIYFLVGLISIHFFHKVDKDDPGEEKENNKLLKPFCEYIGYSLCFIGEIIRVKNTPPDKKTKKFSTKKNQIISKPILSLITDSDNSIGCKEIIYIIVISILLIVKEFCYIYIKILKNTGFLLFNEDFNLTETLVLFILSAYIFNHIYYRHQYISIFLLLSLEITRYIIKIIHTEQMKKVGYILTFHLIRALCECIFYSYSKILIEYKYFSPYKAVYIFGFIITPIMIGLYFLFSYLPFDSENIFCTLHYKNKYYFDNIYALFSNIKVDQILIIIIYIIASGILIVLINIITQNFTICHVFIVIQICQIIFNIIDSLNNKMLLVLLTLTWILEFLSTLVFLEVIELKFCGLNKDIKVNIMNRAEEDLNISDESSSEDINNDNFYQIEI